MHNAVRVGPLDDRSQPTHRVQHNGLRCSGLHCCAGEPVHDQADARRGSVAARVEILQRWHGDLARAAGRVLEVHQHQSFALEVADGLGSRAQRELDNDLGMGAQRLDGGGHCA